jgi:L-seryl-tRNA(Ser) seleniumtransferase
MNPTREGSGAADALRRIPAVDRLLAVPELHGAMESRGRALVTFAARQVLQELRGELQQGSHSSDVSLDAITRRVLRRLATEHTPLPRVLNGTGVILHSGLGRAPLAPATSAAIERARSYALLEVERNEGERHARDARAGALLKELTGAEAALVVNNNAAATLLILDTLGRGREVICSRGELVEIGGSFRIPEVMEASGARLIAVGATNKTHRADYERALSSETAALLVVHTSNYRILGFAEQPPLAELAELAHARGLPLIHDLGSGSLLGPEELGVGDEPPVRQSLAAGADVVCMSGDKLLGGPQAGIILGKRALIDRMRKSPLARAVRVDKFTIAALEATLQLFLDKPSLKQRHPVTRMLMAKPEDLLPDAELLRRELLECPRLRVEVVDIDSETGSGALPTLKLPSVAVALSTSLAPQRLARLLRQQDPALFTRVSNERVCVDLRTVLPGEVPLVAAVVRTALASLVDTRAAGT